MKPRPAFTLSCDPPSFDTQVVDRLPSANPIDTNQGVRRARGASPSTRNAQSEQSAEDDAEVARGNLLQAGFTDLDHRNAPATFRGAAGATVRCDYSALDGLPVGSATKLFRYSLNWTSCLAARA
jgi:hypothetical protein